MEGDRPTLSLQVSPELAVRQIQFLEAHLDELLFAFGRAQQECETAGGATRPAITGAVEAMIKFISSIPVAAKDGLLMPLSKLVDALNQLDAGNVLPLLKPTKIKNKDDQLARGRKESSSHRRRIIALTVYFVDLLIRRQSIGAKPLLNVALAHEAVAAVLREADVRPARRDRPTTARTVRSWCDDAARWKTKTVEGELYLDRHDRQWLRREFDSMDGEERWEAVLHRLRVALKASLAGDAI